MIGGARGVALLCVGLLAVTAFAAPGSQPGDPASPRPPGPLGLPVVSVDKACYFPTEHVRITLRNAGFGRLILDSFPNFEVESPSLGIVRQALGYDIRDVVLNPGDEITFTWNQKWLALDENGSPVHFDEYVPDGDYTAHVRMQSGIDVLTLGSAPFFIGACDLEVDAGPDLVVDEGQTFTLVPDISETSRGTVTSISWDTDPTVDANGDGNPANDADLVGENPTTALGDDGVYVLTLNVRGFLENVSGGIARQDVVFTIDSSGSMSWNDPNDLRKEGAKAYVDLLVPDDRAAVVDFDSSARLVNDHHLSSDYPQVKADIDTIDSFGGTLLVSGLDAALDELQGFGLPFHQWVVIFLTDAQSIFEDDEILVPLAIQRAVSLGVRIYTVGLNVSPFSEVIMKDIAEQTGGAYFPAPDADSLLRIYQDIAREVNRNRGTFFFATDRTTVTVNNVAPTAAASVDVQTSGLVGLTLRVAGEKWHDVAMTVYEDGVETANATILRTPGSPNDQAVTLPEGLLLPGRAHTARVVYTPLDDPVNGEIWGADPAWIIARLANGTEIRFEHTFNVEHPDTWIWDVGLGAAEMTPRETTTLTTDIRDPGTDDVTIAIDWGDGTVESRIYRQIPLLDDPFPSPGGDPVAVTDVADHRYAGSGAYTITVTLTDDDGGTTALMVSIDVR